MRIIGQMVLAYLLDRAEGQDLAAAHQEQREKANMRIAEAKKQAIPAKTAIIQSCPPLRRVK